MTLYLRFSLIYIFIYLLSRVENIEILERRLGTKTPYRFVSNDNLTIGPYPGCTPKKIWMMIRHGTRYPSEAIINFMQSKLPTVRDEILENHQHSKGTLNEDQILAFKKWSPLTVDPSNEKFLTYEGGNEMIELAKRMQNRFPELIPKQYDFEKFKFKYTPTERTNESARHFGIGLFGNIKDVQFSATAKDDSVLRFYKKCPYWQKYVKKNMSTYAELQLYLQTDEMLNGLSNISQIIGYENNITFSLAKLLYQTCAFETAWHGNSSSPWCFVFPPSSLQLEALEYAEDLKYYWLDGYGHPISGRLACTLLNDVLRFFSETSATSAAFHFTHSGTTLMTLTHLGLCGRDEEPPRHGRRDPGRSWRTSRADAFGSNLAFVLHRCDDSVDRLLLLHQERAVGLPECPTGDLCPLAAVSEARGAALERCDLRETCELPPHAEL